MLNVLLIQIRQYELADFYSSIPGKKKAGAKQSYVSLKDDEKIICLRDSTVFGGAKEGICLTNHGIYWKSLGDERKFIRYSDIERIQMREGSLYINGLKVESCPCVNKLKKTLEEIVYLTDPKKELIDTKKEKEVQTYFWTELIKQLEAKGNEPIWSGKKDGRAIEQDVEDYYTKDKNRHRGFGFCIEIYKTKSERKVGFYVEIGNKYYYGFAWMDKPNSDDTLSQLVKLVAPEYKSNPAWIGLKRFPDDVTGHDLDFWGTKLSTSMKRLIDKSQREELIKEIAQEIDEQIRKFKEIAQKENL
jgi:hypothetical protein